MRRRIAGVKVRMNLLGGLGGTTAASESRWAAAMLRRLPKFWRRRWRVG
jgi:hypothetical protein